MSQKRQFYTRTPIWVLLLLPLGVLLAAIVAMAIRGKVEGQLPACRQCTRDRHRFVWLVVGAWVLDFVLLIASVQGDTWTFIGWVILTLGVLCFSFAGDRSRVSGVVTKDRRWVELRGAHQTFVTVMNSWLRPPPATSSVDVTSAAATTILPQF